MHAHSILMKGTTNHKLYSEAYELDTDTMKLFLEGISFSGHIGLSI